MESSPLETPIQFVKGVGPDRAALLAKLEILTVRDLLWTLPRDILDLTQIISPRDLKVDELGTVRGEVIETDGRPLKHGRTLVAALFRCETEFVRGLWFNQPWMRHKLPVGSHWLISGKPKLSNRRFEFTHPRLQVLNADDLEARGEILTRYGLTEGLKLDELRRIIRIVVDEYADFVTDAMPPETLEQWNIPHLRDAIRLLHIPQTLDDYQRGTSRVIFDDLFQFEVAVFLRRRVWERTRPAEPIPLNSKIDQRIRRLFSFDLTSGQNHAIDEIVSDLSRPTAMHRLLQADVGSGKTVIAIYAMLMAIAAKQQTVLMAPTEILAWQHWNTLDAMLAHSQVKRVLLTGNIGRAERQAALEGIASGEIQLIVGTQAVIQDSVRYRNLGLVVIDEQHKFGVMQRSRLTSDERSPHVLVMTATPIPRSLCLTQYGDLSLSLITEKPPGRQLVVTSRVTTPHEQREMWDFLRRQLERGRQLYVICPLIEENKQLGVGSVEQVFQALSQRELAGINIGVLHGRMERDDQKQVMQQFRENKVQALISTTVVEVGVDVANATLMLIVDAQRFGLSQLHQLRGRISRGKHKGYCFLQSMVENEESQTRLEILERCPDGFSVSEEDFKLRGPGDILGTRQHGQLPLQVADLTRDAKLLEVARKRAEDIVMSKRIDSEAWAAFKREVLDRFERLMDLPRTG
ncbi:ATP-dependent DNA helicase RecG [Lacunimicrobium album]